jgi:hypothetical protein
MKRLCLLPSSVLGLVVFAAFVPRDTTAQAQFPYETPLEATRRVFESVGPGFRGIARGPNDKYYILTAPGPAVQIYDESGKRVGQVPYETAAARKGVALVYGESFDVDGQGRVAVSDRGASAVKIYGPDGSLVTSIPVRGPAPVVLLPENEVAVGSPESEHIVTSYDLAGRLVREYGDPEEISDRADVNHQVNIGHLAVDAEGNSYFAFDFLPEPTVRKFDHAGYLTMEISLKTLEFQPAAQTARRAIARAGQGAVVLHRIISAIGVDRQTQEVWLAMGTLLIHFDKDGQRLGTYRTYMPRGARLEAASILVEPGRLLIGADPQGVYEFTRPSKPAP